MAFDQNNYKKIFEQRYGSGSYESGLNQAREIGRTKVQAEFTKQAYNDYLKKKEAEAKKQEAKAKKKTYDDAISYWNDPANQEELRSKGVYRTEQEIRNDPRRKQEIKDAGFNIDDFIDGLYNAGTKGDSRSKREYDQKSKKNNQNVQEYDIEHPTKIKKIKSEVTAPKTKKQNSLWDDIKNPAKRFIEAVNPFDDVSFSEALDKNFTDTANTKRSKPVKETTRALTRIGNMGTFGAVNEATKHVNNGKPFQEFSERKGAGKVADTAYDLLGGAATIIPGAKFLDPLANAGARKILGTKAGQALEGLATSRGIHASTAIKSAIRGAGAMGTYGAIQQGIGEGLNPNEATLGQRALNVGTQAAAGALLDPALSSVGGTIANSALGQRFANAFRPKQQTTPSQELLGLPGPQERLRLNGPQQPLGLNAPQQALPAPRPVEPTLNNFNNFGKRPTGLQSPIPQMPETVLPKRPVEPSPVVDYKALEDAHVQQQLAPHYEYQKQAAEAQTKWQTTVTAAKDEIERIKQTFGKIYVPKDALEDYQVPKQLLASKGDKVSDDIFSFADQMGFSTPDEAVQYLKALDEESRIKLKDMMPSGQNMIPEKDLRYREEALRKEFRAKNPQPAAPKQPEQTALDIPQIAPEDRKVSRVATFDEMYQRMKDTAPAKPESKPLDPLEFRREKGYDLTPKIKNRGDQAAADKKSSLLLPLKPVQLKTVKTTKSVHTMNKKELQGIYQELKTKKETFTKNNNQKKMKQVDEDIKQVEGLLMKLDLQTFGEKAPKNVIPKLKAGGEKATEPITPAKEKNPKQEYAIAQSKQKELVKTYEKKGNPTKTEAAKDLVNSDKWTDKKAFGLGRETITRNFENVMGKDAPKMIKKYIDPVKSSEAERIRFLNKERNQVKSYGIKPKSEEDKLVQMYGEKKITLDELKQKTANWKKVVKVAEAYRNKYDNLLETVNKVLVENGHKPIPKRSDYFPHYEEVDGLMKQFGFDMQNHSLPTDINGLTENFRPSKQYFQFANQRKGDQTTFGAIQGFDKYIEGVSNLIYHTKNIRQLRALEDVIRSKYGDDHLSNFVSQLKEYTNQLAGKKAKVDRVIEETFGRTAFNVVDTIRRKTGANMIGANVSAALTNFIPLTHSLATTEKKAFVKGLTDTISNIVKSDGFVQKSDFLTKRIGSDPLYRTMWDKTVDSSMWLMRTLDSFNAQVIVRGKYNEGIKKGLSEKEAMKQADEWASRMMAARSKGEMPTLFGSKTFGIVSQFQLEVNNQLSFMFKDMPANAESKKALASSFAQLALYSYLFNNLYEKAVGRRPAFDPIGIAFQAKKDYTNDNLTKSDATKNLVTNVASALPFSSIFTSGGRFPISAGVPNVPNIMNGKADLKDEALKPLYYLGLPAGGGQIKKTIEGLTSMNKNPLSPQGTTGVYKNGKLQFPVEDNIPNNIRGALFGKYASPESKEFFDNKRKTLSDKQTMMVEQNPENYQAILFKQKVNSIKKKIQAIQKDGSLSNEEKMKKLAPLFEQLQRR